MGELNNKFTALGIEQIRANVKRTIMSYRSPWDLYTELIQNAVDAIIDKYGYKDISAGLIHLSFNTVKREIIITDNGIGINHSDISSILVMGESLKRKEGRGKYGFMGYGFTFVSFQTEYLKIESVYDGKKASRTYNDLYKVIFDDNELPMSIEEINGTSEEVCSDDSYTKIVMKFPNKFPNETLEKNISSAFHYVQSKEMLEYILRTKSAIGLVDVLFQTNINLFSFKVTVDGVDIPIDTGYFTVREMIQSLYPHTQLFYDINDFKQVIQHTERLDQASRKQARKAIVIDGIFKDVTVGTNNPLNINIYIAETSKTHLQNYNSSFQNLEDYEHLLIENGIWLSIDGLPTGICLDSFSHGSYLPFTVVVDVIDINKEIKNELDSGRKGITEYRASQIVATVKNLLKQEKFIEYREYVLGVDTRVSSDGYDPKREMRDFLLDKKYYNINLVHNYFPLINEQEVISLFTELISRNVLESYFPKVISGYEVYDGLYEYRTEFPNRVLIPNSPIGISEHVKNRHSNINREILIEFKYYLKNILRDVREVRKRLQDVDILVCWSVEYEKSKEYDALGIMLKEVDQSENVYHGVTHEFIGAGRNSTYLPVIELKTVLNKLYDTNL